MSDIKQNIKTLTIFSFVFFLSTILFAGNASNEMVGLKAPIISGKKAKGKGLLTLSKLMTELNYKKDKNGKFIEKEGKYILEIKKNVVILNFFSTDCIPCIKEIPTYNRLAVKYRNHPVKMIYVNVDANVTDLDMQRFIIQRGIKVPMMVPNQKEAMRKYKAFTLPRMVIINREGKIQKIITGFSENLEAELSALIEKLII
jgi:thiol-disulfide isomerase/thioredoxin